MKNKNKKISFFYEMYRLREIEKEISKRYFEWEMRCPVHLSIGQEAIAVGICANLEKRDEVISAHRSHYHYLAKGGDLRAMLGELYGKVVGCAKGKGGSMHLIDNKVGMLAAVPIVGSTIAIGVGAAWANKLKDLNQVVVIFFGDGATEEGIFHESLDFSSLHQLPVLFVCENNNYSVYSSLNKRQSDKRKITNIAKAAGIASYKINGNDVEEVYKVSKESIQKIKKGHGPILLELSTYRWLEHCGPNNDDHLGYRSKNEIKDGIKSCPIENYKKILLKKKIFSEDKIDKIRRKISNEINAAFNFAKKSKFPDSKLLRVHLYAK